MDVIDGTGEIVSEPDWATFLKYPADRAAAATYWRAITNEMRDRNTLAAANSHAIARLVMTYIVYDKAAVEAANGGPVLKPKRGSPKAIARVSPYFTTMKEAAAAAGSMEAELGVSPRQRNSAGVIEKKTRKVTGAAAYLKPVAK